MLRSAVNMMDAMNEITAKHERTPSATIAYSCWALPSNMSGPMIIVDCVGWFKIPARSQGVQLEANTTAKLKVNADKQFSVQ